MKEQRIVYWDSGIRSNIRWSNIRWTINNEMHRDGDLPAKYYFVDGKLYSASYYHYNKLHRATGPAYIDYVSKTKWYYYQDIEYASLEEMLMVEACR